MRKYYLYILLITLCVCGCNETEEYLTINKDGSGTLHVKIMIPTQSLNMINTMVGSMVQAMAQNISDAPPPGQPLCTTLPMFGAGMLPDPGRIKQSAEAVGLQIEMIRFDTKEDENGVYADYLLSFDDIFKLMESDIIFTKIDLALNDQSLICSLKSGVWGLDEKSRQDLEEVKKSIQERSGQDVPVDNKEFDSLMAMGNLKKVFSITLPNKINATSGVFAKVDDYTAQIKVSGNLYKDVELIDELSKLNTDSSIVISSEGISLTFPSKKTTNPQYPLGSNIEITLKNGSKVEGTLIEETSDYIRINVFDIPLSYYKDEVTSISSLDYD